MRQVLEAFREWRQLRGRLRDERRFHFDRASTDLRALGMSARSARRTARLRLGRRVHARSALREIGGDFGGLLHLLRVYRVTASLWLRPLALMAATALMFLASPSPWLLLESIAWRPLHSDRTVYFSAPEPWPLYTGVTAREFEAMRSLRGIRGLERYHAAYARAQADPGVKPAAIESEARTVSGNSHIYVVSHFEQKRIEMGPAVATWLIAALFGLFSLGAELRTFGIRGLAYAGFSGLLHLLASLTAWALAIQIWSSGPAVSALLVAYMLSVVWHCRCWRHDLFRRCPVCLESLLLSSTEGTAEKMLLGAAVTESVCAHGHGILVETRWARHFQYGQRIVA